MSRSYRKTYKSTICYVSRKTMRDWKKWSARIRRHRCKNILDNMSYDDDDESFFPEKYQKDMVNTNDWSGPHDGYHVYFNEDELPDYPKYEHKWKFFDK